MNNALYFIIGLFCIMVVLETHKQIQKRKEIRSGKLFGLSREEKDKFFIYLTRLCHEDKDAFDKEIRKINFHEMCEYEDWLRHLMDMEKEFLKVLDVLKTFSENLKKDKDGES